MKLFSRQFKTFLFFFFTIISIGYDSFGQSYGLGFSSFEVLQDKRTSLDLNPGSEFTFSRNFEVSFEVSYLPNQKVYFGYLVRIIEDGKRSFDIVCNTQPDQNNFYLTTGNNLSNISFTIDRTRLLTQWNKLNIKFDLDHDRILLYADGKSFEKNGLHLKKNSHYKILFGSNNYKDFETTDVPSMKVRNIRISTNNALKYNWPLGEESGQVAHETISHNDALVTNPEWIKAKHRNWQFAQSITVNGNASIAFDAKKEMVYIVGVDSLFGYYINNTQWDDSYVVGKLDMTDENQSGFDPYTNNLYSFFSYDSSRPKKYHAINILSGYNFKKHSWESKFPAKLSPFAFLWHVNKLFSATDTSIYLFGGYAHHFYRNTVQRYNIKNQNLDNIKTNGDFFMPRFLSALGSSAKGDTAYILGGYGNPSGKQEFAPKNRYDMMRFTVKDKCFKKLFDLNVKGESFAFANSLVIDAHSKTYYGLVFPQHKYKSALQLIKGSLTGPGYTLMGSAIPYNFSDTKSYADLYYCPKSKIFVAVTLERIGNNQTRINIYTLLEPPYTSENNAAIDIKNNLYWYIGTTLIAMLLLILGFIARKNKQSKQIYPIAHPETGKQLNPVEYNNDVKAFSNIQRKNAILLFGDMQIFDAEGADITKYFTPLIKELFLVILVYSIRWGRGLSSEKLNEILWYDKSAKSARNNRSVNIAKLKLLLERMNHCQLSKDTGYWKINIDHEQVYVDYYNYLNIVKEKGGLDIQKIKCLSGITQRGGFLSNIEYEWLDTFKSEISNEVINTYLHYAHSDIASQDPEFLIELANYVFYFDPVNEDAMIIKCKTLFSLGKHTLAKHAFENFNKEYKTIYGEEFKMDFHAILA